MKLLEADWSAFMGELDRWRRVPSAARRIFLEFVQPSLPFTTDAAAEALPFLLEAGILVGGHGKTSARVAEELQPFARTMRALYRYRVFDPGHPVALGQYLADHFSFQERQAFGDGELQAAAESVGARGWVDEFLAAGDLAGWERRRQDSRSGPYFATPVTAEPARRLVAVLLRRRRPVEIAELESLECFGAEEVGLVGAVLAGCIRYCLLFPGLRGTDLEPVVGVWPGILAARRRRSRPPASAEPAQSFHAPLLVHDMSTLLVECASAPLPVRRADLTLFTRKVSELAGLLYPLPAWSEAVVPKTPETRVRAAQLFLHGAGYVTLGARRGREVRMGATDAGRRWLALGLKEKLVEVFRLLEREPAPLVSDHRLEYLPSPPPLLLRSGRVDLRAAVTELFRDLEPGRSVEYRGFLKDRCRRANPYLELRRRGMRMSISGGDGYREPEEAELATQWERLIERFFAQRLLVLDAVVLGLTAAGRVCFSVTAAGRRFLGLAPDFDYGTEDEARIVVQPNFDVVFLSSSASAEAAIGRFAERVGREVGTLFRVTKRSVLRGAASGLGASEVLGSLRDLAGRAVPGNVAAEIEGWLGSCRTVRMESALLIRTPDAETTARAAAAAGRLVRVVSETVLEVVDPRRRGPLERKLREEGIFVEPAERQAGRGRERKGGAA